MNRSRLAIYLVALAIALPVLGLAFLRLLLTPASGTGTVLVLLSGRQTDQVAANSLALRSDGSWQQLGRIAQREVPAAPQTDEAVQVRVAARTYDAVRFGEAVLPVELRVPRDLLTPLLITIQDGRPVANRVYAANENVSLGLNEAAKAWVSPGLQVLSSPRAADTRGPSGNEAPVFNMKDGPRYRVLGARCIHLHDVLANDEHVVALTHVNGQRAVKTLDALN